MVDGAGRGGRIGMGRRHKVMLVFGTRPEAIKMAPVHRALRARPDGFDVLCCVTAQHREMLDQVLDVFGIVPDIDLDLMRPGQNPTDLSAAVLVAMRRVLQTSAPDLVLVHGDTTTSMATALAAFHEGVRVGHVEAGLRSHDMAAPFPEELNRRVTALVASYHFAPTEGSKANLLAEGCAPETIAVTGNTVVDALKSMIATVDADAAMRSRTERALDETLGSAWRERPIVLVTCHRRENIERGLPELCQALDHLSTAFPDVHFVFPVHANPALGEQVRTRLADRANIHLIPPVDYVAFLQLLRKCHCVLTDSGGLQEEAIVLGKPVLVMREVTERPEAVTAGGARLIGTARGAIVQSVSELLRDRTVHALMADAPNPFGDGAAGERIAAFLEQQLASSVDPAPPRRENSAALSPVVARR
jgi:UDP-N-acetylglucosamine 2-epimerase (non-hydrolysing)